MQQLPSQMLAWPLFGAGFESLGKNDAPCALAVPEIKSDELLVRIEAIGLCFSDVKLIRAGIDHPRVISKNLAEDPVIPGHEAVMSVVRVGETLRDRFHVGERFIIQADIYVQGKGFAYGYAINGGMAQYSVLDQRVLNGDEGCYLLPIADSMPSAVAALLEPWTCVQASYMIENRTTPRAGGKICLIGGDASEVYRAGALLQAAKAGSIQAYQVPDAVRSDLEKELGLKIEVLSAMPQAGCGLYDDIFLLDVTDPEIAAAASRIGSRGAVISLIGCVPQTAVSVDLGSIHYEGWFFQGTLQRDLSKAYGQNVRSTKRKGGSCWLPGGAGAMGQMHTQLAVESPDGPSRILVSDMDDARIANVKRLLADKIQERNLVFETVNPSKMSAEEFDRTLRNFAPEGFDDIIMLVPVVPVLEQASRYLGRNGVMNIFAGIPAGKSGSLDFAPIAQQQVRYIGSSGSRTAHLRHTLDLAQRGELKPVTALAAIGGMKELKHGLEAVANAKYPGKTVILPNCPDMPLVPISELETLSPEVAATLSPDGFYTLRTETLLRRKFEVESK